MGQKSTTLTPEVIKDLEKTTEFTHAEICDLYRQFKTDSESGLQMGEEEFKKIYREVFPKGDADRFAIHVFRTFDKEGKGSINFREFMSTLNVQLKGTLQEKLEWAFSLYDVHNNGYITKEETLEMIRSLYNLHAGALPAEQHISPQQLTDHVFEKADKKQDNQISRQEFVEAAVTSRTMQLMLEGATVAAGSPYLRRKADSGSFGKPRSGSTGGAKKDSPGSSPHISKR